MESFVERSGAGHEGAAGFERLKALERMQRIAPATWIRRSNSIAQPR